MVNTSENRSISASFCPNFYSDSLCRKPNRSHDKKKKGARRKIISNTNLPKFPPASLCSSEIIADVSGSKDTLLEYPINDSKIICADSLTDDKRSNSIKSQASCI